MDGQDLTFDFAFSNFGACFYPDFVRGFKELHRVLKSGGKAFINAWSIDYPMRIPYEIAKQQGELSDMKMNFLTLSDTSRFRELLIESGFTQVTIETVPYVIRIKFCEFVESFQNNADLHKEQVISQIAKTYNVQDYNEWIQINTATHVASLIK